MKIHHEISQAKIIIVNPNFNKILRMVLLGFQNFNVPAYKIKEVLTDHFQSCI